MKRLLVMIVMAALLLAGCSGGDDDSGSSDSTSTTRSGDTETTTADTSDDGGGGASGECNDLEDEPGFVRAFCDGSATVSYDIDGTTGEIDGGTCEASGGFFVVNAGTVVGPDWSGAPPDYAGFNLPTEPGDIGEVTAALNVDGTSYLLTAATGSRTDDGGSLSGTDMTTGAPISIEFTC